MQLTWDEQMLCAHNDKHFRNLVPGSSQSGSLWCPRPLGRLFTALHERWLDWLFTKRNDTRLKNIGHVKSQKEPVAEMLKITSN